MVENFTILQFMVDESLTVSERTENKSFDIVGQRLENEVTMVPNTVVRQHVYDIATEQPNLLRLFVDQLNIHFGTKQNGPWSYYRTEIQHQSKTVPNREFFIDSAQTLVKDKYLLVFIGYSDAIDQKKREGERRYEEKKAKIEEQAQKRRRLLSGPETSVTATLKSLRERTLVKAPRELILTDSQRHLVSTVLHPPQQLPNVGSHGFINEVTLVNSLVLAHLQMNEEKRMKIKKRIEELKNKIANLELRKRSCKGKLERCRQSYKLEYKRAQTYLTKCFDNFTQFISKE